MRASDRQDACDACGKQGALMRCSCCKSAHYCDHKCQKKAWKEEHKFKCRIAPEDDPQKTSAVRQEDAVPARWSVLVKKMLRGRVKKMVRGRQEDASVRGRQEAETAACRICFEGASLGNSLVCPCPCRGSSAFIHVACIARMYTADMERAGETAATMSPSCPTCKRAYASDIERILMERELEASIQQHGPYARHTAQVGLKLARIHRECGSPRAALRVITEAVMLIDIDTEMLIDIDASLLTTAMLIDIETLMGSVQADLGQREGAMRSFDSALARTKELGPPGSAIKYADILCTKLYALCDECRFDLSTQQRREVAGMCEELLEMTERDPSPDACRSAHVFHMVGQAYVTLDCKLGEAKTLLTQALELMQPVWGETEPVADVLADLALAHTRSGDHDEAERIMERAYMIRWRSSGRLCRTIV